MAATRRGDRSNARPTPPRPPVRFASRGSSERIHSAFAGGAWVWPQRRSDLRPDWQRHDLWGRARLWRGGTKRRTV